MIVLVIENETTVTIEEVSIYVHVVMSGTLSLKNQMWYTKLVELFNVLHYLDDATNFIIILKSSLNQV